ncbi:MAG TPA: hypothetical protein QF753_15985 [Victivallales bacterium]|nr:hypothetical protein [Victivallales bacterium]
MRKIIFSIAMAIGISSIGLTCMAASNNPQELTISSNNPREFTLSSNNPQEFTLCTGMNWGRGNVVTLNFQGQVKPILSVQGNAGIGSVSAAEIAQELGTSKELQFSLHVSGFDMKNPGGNIKTVPAGTGSLNVIKLPDGTYNITDLKFMPVQIKGISAYLDLVSEIKGEYTQTPTDKDFLMFSSVG